MPLKFPLIWDQAIDYISAVNVTDRYLARAAKPPEVPQENKFSASVAALAKHLEEKPDQRPALEKQPFAMAPLSKTDASEVAKLLWQDHFVRIRQSRAAEMQARELTSDKLKMPFAYEVFAATTARTTAACLRRPRTSATESASRARTDQSSPVAPSL